MRLAHAHTVLILLATVGFATLAGADDLKGTEASLKDKDEVIAHLARENALLRDKVRVLETTPTISREALLQRNTSVLKELAASVREQRQTMTDFEGFVKWMVGNLSGYAKYVEAGSVAAGFARLLPVPYAGQASVITKFVSQGAVSLNAASVSINRYLDTSRQFLVKADLVAAAQEPDRRAVSAAVSFADAELLRDMADVEAKLATTAEISASALAFLETVNSYVGSTDAYLAKTKAFLSRKEVDKAEKGYLLTSIEGLKNRAGSFNGKFRAFSETARKELPLVKNLLAYDVLMRELEDRTTQPQQAAKAEGMAQPAPSGKP
ncbi:MAG TPA: hypothetical protein VI389_05785 [Geobacteraceae bacterium]